MPGRQRQQAGEAGQVVMCWGVGGVARQARSPCRQDRSGRHVLRGGAGCLAGKVAQQARPVRPACAG